MATYAGPTVSPVFVTGIVNDAFTAAANLTASARAAVDGINPPAITAEAVPAISVSTDLGAGALPGLADVDDTPADSLADTLTQLLRDFIGTHYPPLAIPDAAGAWYRIAYSFNGLALDAAIARVRARLTSAFTDRGLALPDETVEALQLQHDREASRMRAGSDLNTEILYKTHRKSVDLTGYEIALRAHMDALDAARAFLLGCVLAATSKVADEQRRIARLKDRMQATFFRGLDAVLDANGVELDRLILDKRIAVGADLSAEERKAFVYQQLIAAALDECQSIASQASAALNRVSASAQISGSERTP